LARTRELNEFEYGGDVHLLHVTPTPSTGRHPSRAIVQLSFVVVRLLTFKQRENRSANSRFKVFLITGMFFFSIHESALVMK
jgi:hypothetical protein